MPTLPLDAYSAATRTSVVVERKPYSQPPHTLFSSGARNCGGSLPPATPRYTLTAGCSFASLTTAELMTWSVVV